MYSSSRSFVPSALHSSVRVVENKVSELGSPLLTAVATRSEQVLTSLDRKVRLLLNMRRPLLHACASSPVPSCSFHSASSRIFQGARRLPGSLLLNMRDIRFGGLRRCVLSQVDNALTTAQNVLFPKGLDTAVATSRQQHAAKVEAANEAREAYLKKARRSTYWLHKYAENNPEQMPRVPAAVHM